MQNSYSGSTNADQGPLHQSPGNLEESLQIVSTPDVYRAATRCSKHTFIKHYAVVKAFQKDNVFC